MINRALLYQLLQQYFDFCTTLISKLDHESINTDKLMKQAFALRDAIEKELLNYEITFKGNCLRELQAEIQTEIEELKKRMRELYKQS